MGRENVDYLAAVEHLERMRRVARYSVCVARAHYRVNFLLAVDYEMVFAGNHIAALFMGVGVERGEVTFLVVHFSHH